MDFVSSLVAFLLFALAMYFVLKLTTRRSRSAIDQSIELQKEQLEHTKQIAALQKEHNDLLRDLISRLQK